MCIWNSLWSNPFRLFGEMLIKSSLESNGESSAVIR